MTYNVLNGTLNHTIPIPQQLWSIRQFTGGFSTHPEHAPVHCRKVAAIDWCCFDFTVIVAPDIIDFTYLLRVNEVWRAAYRVYVRPVASLLITTGRFPQILDLFSGFEKFPVAV